MTLLFGDELDMKKKSNQQAFLNQPFKKVLFSPSSVRHRTYEVTKAADAQIA